MENTIVMIPIKQLEHHPENPRKDLGDLSELTESIRKNGIMQNLTVVKNKFVPDVYTVVIGNRRMEAAKAAGMEAVPCVVSEMDPRTQIATMLEENMQRADLTVYEQAQGFQMMMDLGFSAHEISEKTGFGETTVRRRLKMAEMDPKLLKKACEAKETERQITMHDFEQLAQINSVKTRNELLKDIGDRNFEWRLNRELDKQKANAVRPAALKELRAAGITELKESDEYSSKYDRLYSDNVDLSEWKPGEKLIPKTKEKLFFFISNGDTVKFYTAAKKKEKEEQPKKTEAQIEKEKRIENAWKIADRVTEASAEMRLGYATGLKVTPKNAMEMLQWALIASMSDCVDHNYNRYEMVRDAFELKGQYRWELVDGLKEQILKMKQSEWPVLILTLFEGIPKEKKQYESFAGGYRKEMPVYQRNTRLEQCYEWLTQFGYQMSDEEIQMMSGKHACFMKGKAE